MKIRNDSDSDRFHFRLHIAMGSTIDVPDSFPEDKKEYLRRNFTEVTDAPVVVATDTSEPEGYDGFTVSDLRDVCRGRGLAPSNRNKAELIELLEESDVRGTDKNEPGSN